MKGAQRTQSRLSRRTCNAHIDSIGGSSIMTILALTTCLSAVPALSKQAKIGATTVPTKAERTACCSTPYTEECVSSLTAHRTSTNINNDQEASFLIAALRSSVAAAQDFRGHCKSDFSEISNSKTCMLSTLGMCVQSLESTENYLNSSISHLELLPESNSAPYMMEDVLTWLSASATYHTTCMDEMSHCSVLEDLNMSLIHGNQSMVRVANSISLARTMYQNYASPKSGEIPNRRLLAAPEIAMYDMDGDYPQWMRVGVRRLLQSSVNETPYDTVVAKDGSGNYSSVQAAVNGAPSKSNASYVIRIKQGVYDELVNIPSNAYNVMFIGDGINKTIITGNVSVVQNGVTTFRTGTVAIDGDGFLAKDVTFQNTAGAENHQAVATRVDSDKSAFYRCSFEGYQDTLYIHSLRQFYQSCTVYGTVDFIFGNSAAMFQNCNLVCRKPLQSQANTVTAQSRTSLDQNTGFSFQDCSVSAAPELASVVTSIYNQSIKSFLGRPWQEYSRTVFMKTYMTNVINAAGWVDWNGTNFALATLYFAEYQNFGPGGNFTNRVSWATNITDPEVAAQYSISFISGAQWLPQTGIPFSSNI
ncbi:hypothetical protein M758_11G097300 [Ceratodon purpureus]|nr:hypothetical protein M758_11G097300 [Ceratodon purpureus]